MPPRLSLILSLVAGNGWHFRFLHQRFGAGLVAHCNDGLWGRADEDQSGSPAGLRKSSVFREKAISRVHRVGAACSGCFDNRGNVQIGLGRQCAADMDRLIGFSYMARISVGT
jgi:hypothetical protein